MFAKNFIPTLAVLTLASAGLAGCGNAEHGAADEPLAEGMGAIVAAVPIVPVGTQCIEIRTSDYRNWQVRADVTPGQEANIRIAPLTPGTIYLSGTAYSGPCWSVGYGYYGYGYDAGTGTVATWEADSTAAVVEAGRTNTAKVTFHKLADLNVNVDFQDPCVCDEAGCVTVPQSGGQPQACTPEPVNRFDGGGVVFAGDAGAPAVD